MLAGKQGFSQKQKTKNLPFYDEKKLHYGFQIGLHNAYYNVKHSEKFVGDGDSTVSIIPNATAGFSLGFILNFKLKDELWNLRLLPAVVFYDRKVDFQYPNTLKTQRFETTVIEFPVLLKYQSVRRNNLRMYMTGGFMASYEVGNKRAELDDNGLVTKSTNLEVQYGAGFDIYFDMFKFSPEIRFSHGLMNVMLDNGSAFARSIDRLTTHKVAIYINFE